MKQMMFFDTDKLPDNLLAVELNTAWVIRNGPITRGCNSERTSYEIIHRKKPSVKALNFLDVKILFMSHDAHEMGNLILTHSRGSALAIACASIYCTVALHEL